MKLKIKMFAALSLILIFGAVVYAQADTVVLGFKANGDLQIGSIVSLSNEDSDTVELAPADNSKRIYGVVIEDNAAPLTVQKTGQQVMVASSGNYSVLVSNQKGPIKAGDYLSLSKTDGIGAKAASRAGAFGKALEGFDGSSGVLTQQSDGTVIGRIDAQISIGTAQLAQSSAFLPPAIQSLGEDIAGKPVSPIRIYSALGVFGTTLLTSTLLLLGGIKNGMVSIGRNPLSQHSIMRGLAQVIVASTFVLTIGLAGVYLLLRL